MSDVTVWLNPGCSKCRGAEELLAELGLAEANDERLLDALAEHPVLIERPVVIRGDRAVVARPPELLLELLDSP